MFSDASSNSANTWFQFVWVVHGSLSLCASPLDTWLSPLTGNNKITPRWNLLDYSFLALNELALVAWCMCTGWKSQDEDIVHCWWHFPYEVWEWGYNTVTIGRKDGSWGDGGEGNLIRMPLHTILHSTSIQTLLECWVVVDLIECWNVGSIKYQVLKAEWQD